MEALRAIFSLEWKCQKLPVSGIDISLSIASIVLCAFIFRESCKIKLRTKISYIQTNICCYEFRDKPTGEKTIRFQESLPLYRVVNERISELLPLTH